MHKTEQSIKGTIIEGNKRGRLLGYPTANMSIDEQLPEGVYASTVVIEDRKYEAATFIGSSKTFDDLEYKLESYIFDFDEMVYGKTMTVSLYKHIRGNKKFDSEKALIEQMQRDCEEIKKFFSEI